MDHGAFLVARLTLNEAAQDYAWLSADDMPYEPVDPIDFLLGDEIALVYHLYRTQYGGLDEALNIPMPEALLEFNRWVLFSDEAGEIVAFACFKTTGAGLKLGAVASTGGGSAKSALKSLVRRGLNVDSVFAEVSNGLERVVAGHVPEVRPKIIEAVLNKPVTLHEDGRHYEREITGVGLKRKLLVGRPHIDAWDQTAL